MPVLYFFPPERDIDPRFGASFSVALGGRPSKLSVESAWDWEMWLSMGLLELTHILSLRTFCLRCLQAERRAFRQRVDRCILVNVTILSINRQYPKLKIDYSPFSPSLTKDLCPIPNAVEDRCL